jgi:hypothetical protein
MRSIVPLLSQPLDMNWRIQKCLKEMTCSKRKIIAIIHFYFISIFAYSQKNLLCNHQEAINVVD